ncbi:hypothetical protein [uncultured Maricaulis sp.]|jgi:hypothetical protein|uniref:hypothetical protein n=1 Tax=uncultured Maricaulis sp. TaxID=174710 RepID=UPI0030D729F6
MRFGLLLAAGLVAVGGASWAQDYQSGLYDGRDIPGWAYSAEVTQNVTLPTWQPVVNGVVQGVNCNIGFAPLEGMRAEWSAYFDNSTPASFAAELQSGGTDVSAVYLTDSIMWQGRPALRSLMAARQDGQVFEFMVLSISGAEQLTTITCTAIQGDLLANLDRFYQFANSITVYTAPPQ